MRRDGDRIGNGVGLVRVTVPVGPDGPDTMRSGAWTVMIQTETLTREQVTALRSELWERLHGRMFRLGGGITLCLNSRMLGLLFDVEPSTIRAGIARNRREREALAHALAIQEPDGA